MRWWKGDIARTSLELNRYRLVCAFHQKSVTVCQPGSGMRGLSFCATFSLRLVVYATLVVSLPDELHNGGKAPVKREISAGDLSRVCDEW